MLDEEDIIALFRESECLEDDVDILDNDSRYILTTIDSFVSSSDKPLLMPWSSVGYKSIIAALSDMSVKGCWPHQLSISLGLSRLSQSELRDLKRGINKALATYKLGNCFKWDTNYSKDYFVSVAAYGEVSKPPPLRSGVKPGNLICVGGSFGYVKLGLEILLGNDSWVSRLKRDEYFKALEAFLYPKPPFREYVDFVSEAHVSASIDSSDGLARSLHILSRESGIGIEVDKIPLSSSLNDYLSFDEAISVVFYGGEEYIGVFSIPDNYIDVALKYGFEIIGKASSEVEGVVLTVGGERIRLMDRGFIHKF